MLVEECGRKSGIHLPSPTASALTAASKFGYVDSIVSMRSHPIKIKANNKTMTKFRIIDFSSILRWKKSRSKWRTNL